MCVCVYDSLSSRSQLGGGLKMREATASGPPRVTVTASWRTRACRGNWAEDHDELTLMGEGGRGGGAQTDRL